MMRILKILLAIVASIAASIVSANAATADFYGRTAAQSFPTFIRGKWCYGGSIDNHGSKAKTFKRGRCTDNMLTFTPYNRLSKWGETSNGCGLDDVEDTRRGGWIINMTCEGEKIKQFFYVLINNGLGIMDMESANAHTTTLPLTDPLIGHWCEAKNDQPMTIIYKRGVWDCDGNLAIKNDGYQRIGSSTTDCTFTEVKRLPDGYLTRGECVNEEGRRSGPLFHENFEFRIVDNMLRSRLIDFNKSDPGCGVVAENMPDGFLNLRAGPGTKYAVKAKLITGDDLKVSDENENGKWLRVNVPHLHNIGGWVSRSYFKQVRCEIVDTIPGLPSPDNF